MSGAAGANIGANGSQAVIGAYVQDAVAPSANTNFIGMNTKTAHKTNVLGVAIDPAFTAPCNDNAATGGTAQWVKSASVLAPTDKVAIVDGVATKDNSTGTHTVFCNAAVDDYFWAVTTAGT